MPENIRATSDENLIAFAKNIATTYGKMGLLAKRLVTQVVTSTNNIDAVNRVISKVGQLDPESKKLFGNYFVGENLENLEMATRAPAILAAAYEYISEHRDDSDEMRERFARIGAHVDTLSANFANTGGMVVNGGEWPLVDTNNIADAYTGLLRTFAARRADIERSGDNAKVAEFNNNLDLLQTVIAEYDHNWGLSNLYPEHAGKLEDRWSDLWDALNRAELTPELKEKLHQWGFTDAKGNEIPQFKKNGKLDKSGRLAAIIDLTRHDIAKQHAARINEKIDEDALAVELNEKIEFKLYNMAVADKVASSAKIQAMREQNPDYEPDYEPEIDIARFNSDQDYRAAVLDKLSEYGAIISDTGYNAQVDADVNATAGWTARVKSKLRNGAENLGGFFERVFHPISRVDRLANVRLAGSMVDKRTRRIQFIKRLAKGFGSAFIYSAFLTVIVTTVAATTGMSAAVATAVLGGSLAIGIGVKQVLRWRRAQQKANKPTDIHAFLSDKRLVASLGVSAIAVIAMCFGAAGMTELARGFGGLALGVGATKNAVEGGLDTWARGGSTLQAIAAGLANAGAVIAGGLTGRGLTNLGMDWINKLFPRNTFLQTEHTHTEQREVTEQVEHTRTVTDWPTETTHEAAVRNWFGARYPHNPEVMQGLLDAVNHYNADTGANLDPWAALRGIALSGGDPNHGVYNAPDWFNSHGFAAEQIHDAANALHPDGTYDPVGMETLKDLVTHHLSSKGYVGEMPGHTIKTSTDVYQSRGEMPTQRTETWTELKSHVENYDKTDYDSVNDGAYAAGGNYNSKVYRGLRDRIGAVDNYPFNSLRPSDRRKPIEPIIKPTDDERDGDIDVFPPVVVRRPDLPVKRQKPELPAEREKPELPVKPGGDVDIFKPVPIEKPVPKPVVVPILDDDEPEDKIFAITRPQAKAWKDLQERLKKVRAKLKKGPHGSKAAKLREEESKLTYFIKNLCNQIGHYDPDVIDLASKEALLRENLNRKNALIEDKPGDNASQWEVVDWRAEIARLDKKINEQIKEFGSAADAVAHASADESRLYYPMPVPGIQAQKKAARRAEYESHRAEILETPLPKPTSRVKPTQDEIVEDAEFVPEFDLPEYESQFNDDVDLDISNHRVPKLDLGRFKKPKYDISDDEIRVIGGNDEFVPDLSKNTNEKPVSHVIHEKPRHNERGGLVAALRNAYNKIKKRVSGREYFVPESLISIAENANLMHDPVATINGVPIHLVDLTGNNTPITQNNDRAVVVVDIRGLRIPFYLSNGDEDGKAGHWTPLQSLFRDGKWKSFMFINNKLSHIQALSMIADALDNKLGDIRNYRDIELTAEYQASGKDGFVGGADAIEHVNPDTIFRLINGARYESVNNHMIFGTYSDSRVSAEAAWLQEYLDENGLPSDDVVEENMNLLQRWRARRKSKHE